MDGVQLPQGYRATTRRQFTSVIYKACMLWKFQLATLNKKDATGSI